MYVNNEEHLVMSRLLLYKHIAISHINTVNTLPKRIKAKKDPMTQPQILHQKDVFALARLSLVLLLLTAYLLIQ